MSQDKNNTRERKWTQISERERYRIEDLLKEKFNVREIAERMGRHKRTIEREIKRGTVIQVDYEWREKLVYLADVGQRVKEENDTNKGRTLKIGHDHKLVKHIEKKIGIDKFSPDAVIGEIREKKIAFGVTICTKTLYNYIDSGLFLNISNKNLPVKKDKKKRTYRRTRKVALNNLKGRSIEERPEDVNLRLEYGHWEMDCVEGKGIACLLVMTERQSRKELIFKLKSKTQAEVIRVIDALERKYKGKFKEIFKSITMDNGGEFLDAERLEASSLSASRNRTRCYYSHPYSAWERGSNENANKLIRRFVPKGSDIGKLSHAEVKRIERWMNNYPRRILGYRSSNTYNSS